MTFSVVCSGVQSLAFDSWIIPKIKASIDSQQPICIVKEKKVAKYKVYLCKPCKKNKVI